MEENITPPVRITKSFFQRITGIFFEPTSVFQALDEKPDLITAIIIVAIATLIMSIGGVMLGFRNPETIEKFSKLPENTVMMAKYATPIIGGIFAIIFAIGLLLMKAGIIHVIVPFLDGKSTYKKLVTVLGYSYAPMILFSILLITSAILNQDSFTPFTASLGLYFTSDKSGPVINALCSQIDVFSLWSLFLSIQGLSVIYKFNWKKSAAIVLVFWLIGVSLIVGGVMTKEHFFPTQQTQTQQKDG